VFFVLNHGISGKIRGYNWTKWYFSKKIQGYKQKKQITAKECYNEERKIIKGK